MPFPDFLKSARCLDKRRQFKQVLETYQILNTIRGLSQGWKNHPCIKMWQNYPDCLQYYYNIFYEYAVNHHGIKIQKLPPPTLLPKYLIYPPWFDEPKFFYAMKANLCRKAVEDIQKWNKTELRDNLSKEGIEISDYDLSTNYFWPQGD